MNEAKKLAQLGCGIEMINSANERGTIKASIYNCNQGIKYLKTCFKNYEYSNDFFWIEAGLLSITPYYNSLLEAKELAEKYHELWKEKFYKCKLLAEKLIQEAEQLQTKK